MEDRIRTLVRLLCSLAGAALLTLIDDLLLLPPALLLFWGGAALEGAGVGSLARRLLPIALASFGAALLATLCGTSSFPLVREVLGMANTALLDPLPLRLALLLLTLGPLVVMLPRCYGGLLPVGQVCSSVDMILAGAGWIAGAILLLRLVPLLLPPVMYGLGVEILLGMVGGGVAVAAGAIALSAQTASRLLAALLMGRLGALLALSTSFTRDVTALIATAALIDALALLPAMFARHRMAVTAGSERIEMWRGVGLVERGPALLFTLATAVLVGVPGTLEFAALLSGSPSIVAVGGVWGIALLVTGWILLVLSLLRLIRALYLRPPQQEGEHRRVWRRGYVLLAAVVALLALPPLSSYVYRAARRGVSLLVPTIQPSAPPSQTP